MTRRPIPFALLALLALLVAACTSERLGANQCEFDADCASGFVCASHVCRAQCRADSDCTAPARCMLADNPASRACVPPPAASTGCVRDSDCRAGEACLGNVCRPACQADYDCQVINPLSRCESGACVLVCSVGIANCDGLMPNGCEVNVRTSPAHCGGCGRACPAGEVCSNGACASTCGAGLTNCAGACVDVTADVQHCGRCGAACPMAPNAVPTCATGRCGFTCAPGFGDCDGDPANGCEAALNTAERCGTCTTRCSGETPRCGSVEGVVACTAEPCAGALCGGVCVDTRTDARNCGACGTVCPAGANGTPRCDAGRCAVTCTDPSSFGDCDGTASNGCEVDLRVTATNCGACGTSCPAAPNATGACVERACAIRCNAGFGDCDGDPANGCEVDLRGALSNCGACGTACNAPANSTASCASSACTSRCNAGFADCDRAASNGCEVDTQSDRSNCGACGRACVAGEVCSGGACRSTCAAGETNCAGECATLASSLTHCGACGNACPSPANATPSCASGACRFVCATGFGDCDGAASNGCETNVTASASHCGACGRACSLANARAACSAGACTVASCNAGFGDCNRTASDGCETNLTTSVTSCGACGRACSLANATAACSAGACAVARCNAGFGDCDGNPANGCEVDLRSTASSCGACGSACALPHATAACAAGACAVATCDAGWGDCDGNPANGCEVDLTTATANCGRCGSACVTGQVCSNSACTSVCASPTTFCAGRCVNLQSDTANCGACGTVCPARTNATATCARGTCGIACSAGFADCDGNATNGCEVNLATSTANCGSCGNVCSTVNGAASCAAGRCGIACSTGFGDCDGSVATGCETDLRVTTSSCGACGAACSLANATPVCAASVCGVGACNAGWGNCDRVASNGCETNTNTSPANCGACGTVCNATNGTATCAGGACGITCATGFGNCDGLASNGCETDVRITVAHCGACGSACSLANATATCTGGACAVLRCNAGFADCDGVASNGCEVNLTSSAANCGRCGNVCSAGFVCNASACTLNCGSLTNCSGTCVNLTSDASNCGACGTVCRFANATAACAASTCGIASCNAGWGNCDGVLSNGCETSLLTSLANCGACGTMCSFANAAASCARGTCALGLCTTGFGNCDGVTSNGCEANLNTSPTNCGACGTACPVPTNGAATCTSGGCGVVCNPGYYALPLGSTSICVALPPPQRLSPSSFSTSTTRRPVFRWAVGFSIDGARLQVCATADCATPTIDVSLTGTTYTPTVDLPVGRMYWRVYGRRGTNTGLTPSPVWQVYVGARTAARAASFGVSPDYNGDGYADFAVADPYATTPTVRVYYGTTSGLPSNTYRAITNTASTFGQSVSPAGDVNGDGYGDLVVGAPGVYAAYVYLGSASGLGATPVTIQGPVRTGFGASVSWAGDTNDDGYGDVIIGACNGSVCGNAAYVYHGASSGIGTTAARTLMVAGATGFGTFVRGAGELNNDEPDDVVVGTTGGFYSFHGTSLSPTYSTTVPGFGDLAYGGDVNGDGYGDVAVGAALRTTASVNYVRAYYGGSAGLTGTFFSQSVSTTAGESNVVGVGDVNGDGYGDLVWATRGLFVRVYRGALGAPVADPIAIFTPTAADSDFGWALWYAGDLNGDRVNDLLYESTNTSPCRRVIRAYHGPVTSASAPASTMYLPLVCLI